MRCLRMPPACPSSLLRGLPSRIDLRQGRRAARRCVFAAPPGRRPRQRPGAPAAVRGWTVPGRARRTGSGPRPRRRSMRFRHSARTCIKAPAGQPLTSINPATAHSPRMDAPPSWSPASIAAHARSRSLSPAARSERALHDDLRSPGPASGRHVVTGDRRARRALRRRLDGPDDRRRRAPPGPRAVAGQRRGGDRRGGRVAARHDRRLAAAPDRPRSSRPGAARRASSGCARSSRRCSN